jgi:signal transduction histidine kinase
LNRIRPGQKEIIRFKHDPDDPNSLPDDWVRQLLVDQAGRLWIHTMRSGWCWMDIERETITVGHDLRTSGMPDNSEYESNGFINREGNLVMGYRNRYFEVEHTTLDIIPYARLTDTTVNTEYILQDDRGRLWFINKRGFGYTEAPFEEITYFFDITKSNFPAAEVNTLNLDNDGFLWLATRNGIFRFDLEHEEWVHFGYERGLQDYYFRGRVNHKGPSGRIYFSGTGGANVIDPEKIRINPFPPEMVFTRLRLDEEDVVPGPGSPLQQSIEMAESITVGPEVSVISLDFSAIHFAGINANHYQYKLEGFDRDWRDGGTIGNAVYTNLSNGHYSLQIRGSNWDGVWSDGSKSIAIRILPPWYKTWWAYALYALILLFAGWRLHQYQKARTIKKERERSQRRELEQARVIEKAYTELKATQAQLIHSEKMASLGELTAGIAHEIQNPLNFVNNFSDVSVEMMEELTDEMKKGNREEAEAIATDLKQNLEKIHHHGQRASGIVKGMLEHSRAGNGEKKPTDINVLADEYLRLAFHGLRAKDKTFQADFRMEPDENLPHINVVPQDLGRVVLNLINNAFYAVTERKKTADDAYKPAVVVSTAMRDGRVEIRVKDNGNGIPREVKEKIFQPFFTTKPTGLGTGLGLSLSFDIITKGHGGELIVETEEGKGTTFIIQLPGKN